MNLYIVVFEMVDENDKKHISAEITNSLISAISLEALMDTRPEYALKMLVDFESEVSFKSIKSLGIIKRDVDLDKETVQAGTRKDGKSFSDVMEENAIEMIKEKNLFNTIILE